jgi:hypothetical protein
MTHNFIEQAFRVSLLGGEIVTGAKPWAKVEILLAPTRVVSIQPDCDRPE